MRTPPEANRITLPQLRLTAVTSVTAPGSIPVFLEANDENPTYFRMPVRGSGGKRTDGTAKWVHDQFLRFPIVLDSGGAPWFEANEFLISIAEIKTDPNMLTLGGMAGDLAAYRRFLDEEELNWLEFGDKVYGRPTYRFSGALKRNVRAGILSPSVASRRMNLVIRFYRWLEFTGIWSPRNAPWNEKVAAISFRDDVGRTQMKRVVSTNISIHVPESSDAFPEFIEDGGKLRPLESDEQAALIETLLEISNVEVRLIHLIALTSGAREQTALTLRLKHINKPLASIVDNDVRILCGPGTGIDTKRGKKGVLHLSRALYEKLQLYARSKRATLRREKNGRGHGDNQYLFLTQHGNPFYESIEDRAHPSRRRNGLLPRGTITGQALRAYIRKEIVPRMREKLKRPAFDYRHHDLRATFGLNYVDFRTAQAPDTNDSRDLIMREVQALLWHSDRATSERYMNYRRKIALACEVQDQWEDYLAGLMRG